MTATPLHPHEVHVWFIQTDAIADAGLLRTCEEVLSPQEKETLQVTRLDSLWPICGSREEAMQRVGTP